jgi:hypothetical protein
MVIKVFDAGFELAALPLAARCASSRETARGRLIELLKDKNM